MRDMYKIPDTATKTFLRDHRQNYKRQMSQCCLLNYKKPSCR